jgi:hypothetical protein
LEPLGQQPVLRLEPPVPLEPPEQDLPVQLHPVVPARAPPALHRPEVTEKGIGLKLKSLRKI